MEMLRINCVPVGNAIQFTGIIHAFVWDNCHVLRVTSTHPPAQLTNASPVAQLHYSLLQLVIKSSCLKAFSHPASHQGYELFASHILTHWASGKWVWDQALVKIHILVICVQLSVFV